jgi:hypothetical protein
MSDRRLIEYEFSTDDTYALLFGDHTMSPVRNGLLVYHEEGSAYPKGLTFANAADKLSYKGSLTAATEDYQLFIDLIDFANPAAEAVIGNTGLVVSAAGALIIRTTGVGGTDHATGVTLTVGSDVNVGIQAFGNPAIPFKFINIFIDRATTPSYTVELATNEDLPFIDTSSQVFFSGVDLTLGRTWFYADQVFDRGFAPNAAGYADDVLWIDGPAIYNRDATANTFPLTVVSGTRTDSIEGPVRIQSPYRSEDLFELRFVQREDVMYFTHPSYPEYRLSRSSHTQWVFEIIDYTPPIDAPSGLSGTYNGTGTAGFNIEYIVASIDSNGEESLPTSPVSVNGDPSSDWEAGKWVALSWTAEPGAVAYVVYKNSRGYFGYIGDTEGTDFKDDNIAPDAADGPRSARDPFNSINNYPAAVGIHQQRKVYGRTNNNPSTTWLTTSGTMTNLSVARPLKPDDAITAQLDSNQVNEILHYIPMTDLIVITNNGVWNLNSGANNDTLTPTTIRYDKQSADGGSRVPPVVVGNTLLMVPAYRRGVREFFYNIQSRGLDGSPLEILADHLFEDDKIRDWCYQRDDSIIWCVMESGKLCTLTYLREHEVVAWTTHDTEGEFKTACCVRYGERDVPHFVVERDGVQFVEVVADRGTNILTDAMFLDSAAVYSGDAALVIGGLHHLAGKAVTVVIDGVVYTDQTIDSDGTITLPVAGSYVVIGYPYAVDFETLDLDYPGEEGAGFGNQKNIAQVVLSLEESIKAQIGPDEGKLTSVQFNSGSLFTGKHREAITNDWENDGRIHVKLEAPYPLSILAHIAEFDNGEN